jgi:tyramine---L-glutamate ligase
MTTVFVYEDVTASGAGGDSKSPPAPSLLAEGRAMLEAVLQDFRRALAEPEALATGRSKSVAYASGSEGFCGAAAQASYTLLIAPETGGRLEYLCRLVLDAGGKLLGPSPDAIHLTADKLELARHWQRHCVPTPATWLLGEEPQDKAIVVKPRDGAGSQGISPLSPFRGEGPGERGLGAATQDPSPQPPPQGGEGEKEIAQVYVPGFAASVAFLIGPHTLTPLLPCEQILSDDGRFRYLGGRLPIAPALAERAKRIAAAAVECVSGLLGYVGVDVVLGNDGQDWAIEINPRLTTSYVGLRALARFNLAEAMLAAVRGEPLPEMLWNDGPTSFTPDGRVSSLAA